MLALTLREGDLGIALCVEGSIDALTAQQLEAALKEQLGRERPCIVLDLGGVDFTSSTGLRLILATTKEARRLGGDLRLAAVRPSVLRVLHLSGFLSVLRTYPDADAALASFHG